MQGWTVNSRWVGSEWWMVDSEQVVAGMRRNGCAEGGRRKRREGGGEVEGQTGREGWEETRVKGELVGRWLGGRVHSAGRVCGWADRETVKTQTGGGACAALAAPTLVGSWTPCEGDSPSPGVTSVALMGWDEPFPPFFPSFLLSPSPSVPSFFSHHLHHAPYLPKPVIHPIFPSIHPPAQHCPLPHTPTHSIACFPILPPIHGPSSITWLPTLVFYYPHVHP